MIRFYEALRRGDDRGFTLIELLIVVAVIAILAVIAIPNFLNARKRATLSSTKANVKNIATALETYQADNDSYPYSGGADLTTAADLGLEPNYIKEIPTDPSGGNYYYTSNGAVGTATSYVLRDAHDGDDDIHRNSSGSASAYAEEGGVVKEITGATAWPTP